MPGAVRFSTVLIIAAWVVLGGVCVIQLVPHTGKAFMIAIIILCGGAGAIYGLGRAVTKKNPYHQEALVRYVVRSITGRNNLET